MKALVSVAFGLLALASTRQTGQEVIDRYAEVLFAAQSLTAEYSYQPVGGAAETYRVELAKPDRARLETPAQIIVADGKQITVFDRAENHYFRKSQNEAELRKLFAGDALGFWAPFFDANALKSLRAKGRPSDVRRGEMILRRVDAAIAGQQGKTLSLFVDAADGVLRQAVVDVAREGGPPESRVMNARRIELGGSKTEISAFVPPAGAKEVKEEDLMPAQWLTSLDQAIAEAKRTKRRVLVDFYADWCTFCKMLDRDVFSADSFRRMSKYFVFCKIDADRQPEVSQRFSVTGLPTIVFLNSEGAEISRFSGYRPLQQFIAAMNAARS